MATDSEESEGSFFITGVLRTDHLDATFETRNIIANSAWLKDSYREAFANSKLRRAAKLERLPQDKMDRDDDGDFDEVIPFDFLGNPRTDGDGLDIGAVNFEGPGSSEMSEFSFGNLTEPSTLIADLVPLFGEDSLTFSVVSGSEHAGLTAELIEGNQRLRVISHPSFRGEVEILSLIHI